MSLNFATFADKHMMRSLNRIQAEAHQFGVFDTINILNEDHLDADFMTKHLPFIKNNFRGYGFWIWKPQVRLLVGTAQLTFAGIDLAITSSC